MRKTCSLCFIDVPKSEAVTVDDLVVHETKVCSVTDQCIAFNVNHLFFGCKKSVLSIWCIYSGEGKYLHTAARANVCTLLLGTIICSSIDV